MCKFVSMLGCDRVCKSFDKILRNGLGKEDKEKSIRELGIIDKILIDWLTIDWEVEQVFLFFLINEIIIKETIRFFMYYNYKFLIFNVLR